MGESKNHGGLGERGRGSMVAALMSHALKLGSLRIPIADFEGMDLA